MPRIYEGEYRNARNLYMGWCEICEDFTRDSTEPDAQGYECPNCEQPTVVGAEEALVLGLVDIRDDELSAEAQG